MWLLTAGERPTAAVTQLLEARPHEHATIGQLIASGGVRSRRHQNPIPFPPAQDGTTRT